MSMFHIVDGKIHEVWIELDAVAGMNNLGLLPPEGASPFGFIGWSFKTLSHMARLEMRAKRAERAQRSP
jgi:hypothetical protein